MLKDKNKEEIFYQLGEYVHIIIDEDDMYYILENGVMKREYSPLENMSPIQERIVQTLEIGDIVIINDKYNFVTEVSEKEYSFVDVDTRVTSTLLRENEDDLSEGYLKVINPLYVYLKEDETTSVIELLASNPANAERISLPLSMINNDKISSLLEALISK